MSLDFQQVRQQIRLLGEKAPARQAYLENLRSDTWEFFNQVAGELDALRDKVQRVVREYDPNLRCACPFEPGLRRPEPLNARFEAGELTSLTTILAADGSQIAPDRHAPAEYCLLNVGAVQARHGSPEKPEICVNTQLFYDEDLYTETGSITEARLALMRDLEERALLATLAEHARAPVITFTDGPMELWGSRDGGDESYFQQQLEAYKNVLVQLRDLKAATAGYVDKPSASPVVRLLEIALLQETELPEVRKHFPLRGVNDIDLFRRLLAPGERSAVYALQSRSANHYRQDLGLHFFYLNVGRPKHSWIARVEIPAWVAANDDMLANLQAALISQCRMMGARPYPYLLHRAHEVALVSLQEKEQVTNMILLELRRRGLLVGEQSYKQTAKSLPGRTSYKGGRS